MYQIGTINQDIPNPYHTSRPEHFEHLLIPSTLKIDLHNPHKTSDIFLTDIVDIKILE